MHGNLRIACVVPCYNEAANVGRVIKTMPAVIDKIYIVDDLSSDNTIEMAQSENDPRVQVIAHSVNSGVGAAIASGYKQALADGFDIAVVMAGDGQMDPADVETVIRPVASGEVDYCKGNRFFTGGPLNTIPRHRLVGNIVLSAMTKIVSGYWHVSDTQCGYTAINRDALASIDWDRLYPRYGCPNDILVQLNIAEMRVGEVPVAPVYGPNWTSKMKPMRVFAPILWLLLKRYIRRVLLRYAINNGHPIVFYTGAAGLLVGVCLISVVYISVVWAMTGVIPQVALLIGGFCAIISSQLLLASFSLDYDINRPLCVDLRQLKFRGIKSVSRTGAA